MNRMLLVLLLASVSACDSNLPLSDLHDDPVDETGNSSLSSAPGKLGGQVLGRTTEFNTFNNKVCPRVAKWVAPDYTGLEDLRTFKANCPGSYTIVRAYSSNPHLTTYDGYYLWADARYNFVRNATAAQKAAIDYIESDNECDAAPYPTWCFESLDHANKFGFMQKQFADAIAAYNRVNGTKFKPLIGNIAVGNPVGDLTCPSGQALFAPVADAITYAGAVDTANGKYGGAWSYHGYTPTWNKDYQYEKWFALRYREFANCYPQIKNVKLILTEAGFDSGGSQDLSGWSANGSADQYIDWLGWFQSQLAADSYVAGATLFAFAPSGVWSSFRLDPIESRLEALVRPPSCGRLNAGQSLSPGQTLRSCNGAATLAHQGDGNVVVYDRLGALWYTATAGKATSSFVMQGDGNLVLYSNTGAALWNAGTWGHSGAYLRMQDDCNLVVYDSSGHALWASYKFCR